MKNPLLHLLLTSILILASCGSDGGEVVPVTPPAPTPENNLTDSIGTAERPQWATIAVDGLDPTTCQIVVVTQAELPVPVDDTDLLAAFIADECRAVASPCKEPNGKTAFTLTIQPKVEMQEIGLPVELQYYSAHNKRIYIAKPFAFTPGETLGSLTDNGYKLILK